MKKQTSHADITELPSVADLILYSAKHAPHPLIAEPMKLSAQFISTSKRFSYDIDFLDAVRSTKSVGLDEVMAAGRVVGLPFDRIWIEGLLPGFKKGDPLVRGGINRHGMIVQALPNNEGFEFTTISGLNGDPVLLDSMKVAGRPMIPNIRGEYALHSRQVCRMSFETGLEILDRPYAAERMTSEQEKSVLDFEKGEATVNMLNATAEFLTRSFAMLGSGVVQHNVRFSETPEDRKSERQLRDANRLRAFPRVPLQPIVIDVSGDVATALKSNNAEQIRVLLGITSVRRSKPITSKHGVVFTRQPHE